eukprot:6481127-Prymnesium_polylepis.1
MRVRLDGGVTCVTTGLGSGCGCGCGPGLGWRRHLRHHWVRVRAMAGAGVAASRHLRHPLDHEALDAHHLLISS